MTKYMSNSEIMEILRYYNSKEGAALRKKRLPVLSLYSLHWNIQKLNTAYRAYEMALVDVCRQYGCTIENMKVEDPEQQKALIQEVAALLEHETAVDVEMIDHEILNACGNGIYDPVTMEEYEHLAWMFS